MPRDPEKRARSREMDKLRKRARRAIERLNKISETTTDMRKRHAAKQQLTQLQAQLDASYAGKRSKTYSAKALEAASKLRGEKVGSIKELKSSTYDFRREMRKASKGQVSALGAHGQLKTQMFWRATQNAWQGLSSKDRERAVLDALGVDTIEAAYNKVMNTSEMREALKQLNTQITDTDEISAAYEQAERVPKRIDSPNVVLNVQMMEFVKAYAQEA